MDDPPAGLVVAAKKPRSTGKSDGEKAKDSHGTHRKQHNEVVRNNVEWRRKMAVCEQEVQDVKDENFELSKRNVMLVAEVERLRARPAPLPNKESVLHLLNSLLLVVPALRNELVAASSPDGQAHPPIPPSAHIHNFSALPPQKVSATPEGLDPAEVMEVDEEDLSRYQSPILALVGSRSDRSLASSSSTSSLGQADVERHPNLSSRSHSRNSRASRRSSGMLSLEPDDVSARRRKSPTPESEDGDDQEFGIIPDERRWSGTDYIDPDLTVHGTFHTLDLGSPVETVECRSAGGDGRPMVVASGSRPLPASVALTTPLHQPIAALTIPPNPDSSSASSSSSTNFVNGAPRKGASTTLAMPEASPSSAGPSNKALLASSSSRPAAASSVSRKPVISSSTSQTAVRPSSAASNSSTSSTSTAGAPVKARAPVAKSASTKPSAPAGKLTASTSSKSLAPKISAPSVGSKPAASKPLAGGSMVKMKDLAQAIRKPTSPTVNAEASSSKIRLDSQVPSPPSTPAADLTVLDFVPGSAVTSTTSTSDGSEEADSSRRAGRRASKSVNYKEPSLTAKMRKPGPSSSDTKPTPRSQAFPSRPHSPRPEDTSSPSLSPSLSCATPSYVSRVVPPPPPSSSAATRRKSVLPKKKSLQDLSDAAGGGKRDESDEEELLRESDYSAAEEDDEDGVEDILMDDPPPKKTKAKKAIVRKRHEDSTDSEEDETETSHGEATPKPAASATNTTTKPRNSIAPKPATQGRRASTAAVPNSTSLRNLPVADASDVEDDDDPTQATPKAFRIITPAPRASLAGGGVGAKRRESGLVPLGVSHGNAPAVEAIAGPDAAKKGVRDEGEKAAVSETTASTGPAGRRVSRRVTMGIAGGAA